MELSWSRLPLKLAGPFRTAKAHRGDKETLWVKISHSNIVGWGEAAPVDTYQQSLDSAEGALGAIRSLVARYDPIDAERLVSELLLGFPTQLATVAAVDAALHDWLGKKCGMPCLRLFGLNPEDAPLTSFTIGINEPEQIESKLSEAAEFPILKIKLGSAQDVETLEIVRRLAPKKAIRVDANTAWSADEALEKLPYLASLGVEFIEQPVPAGDLDGLKRLKQVARCPIVADESCIRPADVVRLAGCVDGINIKLSKCGGIREALKMIHVARACGLRVMLGCMIESSLGIAAAAQLAPLADWLDLDGHLLLASDPFTGIDGRQGRLRLAAGPGLGVIPAFP